MQDKKHFVYLLLTERDTYYCGYTNDVEKRFETHRQGKGAKYTRANKPVKIAWFKEFPTKEEALKTEYKIKRFSHKEKQKLVLNEGF